MPTLLNRGLQVSRALAETNTSQHILQVKCLSRQQLGLEYPRPPAPQAEGRGAFLLKESQGRSLGAGGCRTDCSMNVLQLLQASTPSCCSIKQHSPNYEATEAAIPEFLRGRGTTREALLPNLGRLRDKPPSTLPFPTALQGCCQARLEKSSVLARSGVGMAQLGSYSLIQQQLGELHVVGAGHGGESVLLAFLVPDLLQFP